MSAQIRGLSAPSAGKFRFSLFAFDRNGAAHEIGEVSHDYLWISGPPTLVKQDVKVSSPKALRERECALAVVAGRTK